MAGERRAQKIQANVFKMIDANSITAGSPETVWTVTGDKRIRLLGWRLSASAAAAIEFQDSEASGTVIAQTPLLAIAGIDVCEDLGDGILLPSNSDLAVDVTATAALSGMVWGTEEAAGHPKT
jgi:hypothetical protein